MTDVWPHEVDGGGRGDDENDDKNGVKGGHGAWVNCVGENVGEEASLCVEEFGE